MKSSRICKRLTDLLLITVFVMMFLSFGVFLAGSYPPVLTLC
jgi:hypothetical protein